MKRVAIIGTGSSGLSCIKHSKEHGLEPVAFEKSNIIGGLWSAQNTAIWPTLHANASKFIIMYSDYPWPKDVSIYPSAMQVQEYLVGYAKRFDLEKHVKLNCPVDSVCWQSETCKWEVTYTDLLSNEENFEIFDFLMIATGQHSVPRMPKIPNSEKFKGLQVHSRDFRPNDPKYEGKQVIVLGNSLSGLDVSAHLVGHSKSIINVFKRPYLISPRLVKFKRENGTYGIIPIELLFHRRCQHANNNLSEQEANRRKFEFLSQLYPYQTNKSLSNPEMFIDLNESVEYCKVRSDHYIEYIRKGKITPIRSRIKCFDENGIYLENESYYPADVVVYCTGYLPQTKMFNEETLRKLNYSELFGKCTFLLYKYTFHPDIENFAMIDQTDGLFFAGAELQAKWASMVFSGKLSLPPKDYMRKCIQEDEKNRSSKVATQFPYGAHLKMIDDLAKQMDLLPDLGELKEKDADLYDLFFNFSAISSNFIFKSNKSLAIEVMKQVRDLNTQVYDFDGIDSTSDMVIQEFSKHFKF